MANDQFEPPSRAVGSASSKGLSVYEDVQWFTNRVTPGRFSQELELADKGNAEAQFHVALCYEKGIGTTPSQASAAIWCEKAAKQGLPLAQDYYGWMYENGFGVQSNAVTADEWYLKAADQNDARGQYDLAYNYAFGIGVTQDYHKAFELYQLAANQNHLPAIHNLANAYLQGHGVEQNDEKAVELFKKAARAGLPISQWALATYYGSDIYGVTNEPESMLWLQMGAKNNEPHCQNLLGWKLRASNPSDKDLVMEGWYWTARAASNGMSSAQFNLGVALILGTYGLETNVAEGLRYLRLAALQDSPKALGSPTVLSPGYSCIWKADRLIRQFANNGLRWRSRHPPAAGCRLKGYTRWRSKRKL